MSEVDPEILYQLQQMRAVEMQEQAATARLAAQVTTTWGCQRQPIRQLRVYLTKVVSLLSGPTQKPAPGCC